MNSKVFLHGALLVELRFLREEFHKTQLHLYDIQLQEELELAFKEFQETIKANVEIDQETTEVDNLEPIMTEELFYEQLQKIKQDKLEAFKAQLVAELNAELLVAKNYSISVFLKVYSSELNLDRLKINFFELYKNYILTDALIDSLLRERFQFIYGIDKFFNKLTIRAWVDPLFFLFLYKSYSNKFSILIKKLKIKKKRYKFKKRKLRKLYVLRKARRIIIFRKIKRRYYQNTAFNDTLLLNFSNTPKKILIKRIPVSERVLEAASVEFFYKLNKKTDEALIDDFAINIDEEEDLLIYLRNYHQKPYFKFRKARIAHWNLFFHKTLRKQRYKGFIERFVKKPEKLSYVLSFLTNLFTKLKFSWTRLDKLESFFKLYSVTYSKQVARIPMIFTQFFKWKSLKRRSFILRKKVGRWSYLNFRRSTCPWLQKKKNTPKIHKHIQPNLFYFNCMSYWDFMTGFIFTHETLRTHSLAPSNQFKANLLVKLHMYRYKANKKCMLLFITDFFYGDV